MLISGAREDVANKIRGHGIDKVAKMAALAGGAETIVVPELRPLSTGTMDASARGLPGPFVLGRTHATVPLTRASSLTIQAQVVLWRISGGSWNVFRGKRGRYACGSGCDPVPGHVRLTLQRQSLL